MLSPNIFTTIFIFPILNLMVALYKLFLLIHLPGAFGFSIIALTFLVRLALHPFFKQQIETSKKMQAMKPHLDRLSQQHKKDPKRLQAEQMKLYQQAGINPASGCLFMVIQIPIFIGLYNTLSLFLRNGTGPKLIAEINHVLYFSFLKIQTIDPHFFGFNIAVSPAKAGIWYYYLIPVITAILQYFQAQSATPPNINAAQPAQSGVLGYLQSSTGTGKNKKQAKNEQKTDTAGDFQTAMNTQMKFIFPLMIGWFSYTLPAGLSLYWNIFSLFSIMQYKRFKDKVIEIEDLEKK